VRAVRPDVVAALPPTTADLTRRIEEIGPDIILIQTDAPSRDTLEHLAVINAAATGGDVCLAICILGLELGLWRLRQLQTGKRRSAFASGLLLPP